MQKSSFSDDFDDAGRCIAGFYCQRDMKSSLVLRQGRCTHFFMTDSEGAVMTS